MKENSGQVLVQAPTEVANYLLNEKRRAVSEIEQRHETPVVIVADHNRETPHFEVRRVRVAEMGDDVRPSYGRISAPQPVLPPQPTASAAPSEAPAVTRIMPMAPAPLKEEIEPTEARAATSQDAPARAKGKGLWGAF